MSYTPNHSAGDVNNFNRNSLTAWRNIKFVSHLKCWCFKTVRTNNVRHINFELKLYFVEQGCFPIVISGAYSVVTRHLIKKMLTSVSLSGAIETRLVETLFKYIL